MFPTFITGEPRRDYNFTWVIVPLGAINGIINATYVSQLAQTVTLPTDSVLTKTIQIGTVQVPVPVGISTEAIQVTYLEDDLGTVYNSHYAWMNLPRQKASSLTIDTLYKYSGIGIYMPTSSHLGASEKLSKILGIIQTAGISLANGDEGQASEVPTGYEIYSHLFPTNVQRTTMDKGGQSLAGVTVTYTRIPRIFLGNGKLADLFDKPAGKNPRDKYIDQNAIDNAKAANEQMKGGNR